ncbi:MAG TPA: serine hydrolase domain-containing protein, partial [Rhizomicrobium sp.]|nr:serine hydrolase domain-containing protein [Rhizomicrobium sp.]
MRKALILALSLLATPVAAQLVIPDSTMGHTLSDYLAAMNSGDTARMDGFKTAHHFGVPTERMQGFFRQTGGIVLLKIESNDDTSIVALGQEKASDRTLRLTIKEIGTADAPKLSVLVEGVPRPAEFAIPRLSGLDAIKGLDDLATRLVAKDRLSGAMLIERKGTLAYEKTWGLADRSAGTPITTRTKFRLGSDNKMFTAVAALQLVASGKLSLEGKVGDYLPNYPNKDVAAKVTIRMLLSHSGGTGDFFGPEFDKNRLTLKHNEDYITLFGDRAPLFEPGTKERYSNYGFILLGSIVQHVSGEDYYAYVRRHIFLPAGMTDTDSLPEDVPVRDRATGYMLKDDTWVPNTDTLPYRGMAAGGGYSTV